MFVFGFCTGVIVTYMVVYRPSKLHRDVSTQFDEHPRWFKASQPRIINGSRVYADE